MSGGIESLPNLCWHLSKLTIPAVLAGGDRRGRLARGPWCPAGLHPCSRAAVPEPRLGVRLFFITDE